MILLRKLFFLLSCICFFLYANSVCAIELDIYSKNALLYNLDENTVLYEKGANEQIAIASLTKLMTAIVTVENLSSLDEKVVLTAKDFEGLKEANAAVAGFRVGQRVTYRDLLYGLLLPSGADAALALARNVAGSRAKFVELMNKKANELGLKNTHFMNETGLDAKGHYSTLEDGALLFKYVLNNTELKRIIESSTYTMSDNSFSVTSSLYKNQKRYGLDLDYIKGGKTGTTDDAGLCLASIASKNGTNYMLVTARAPYDKKAPYHFYDAKTIYEYFMNHFQVQEIVKKGTEVLNLDTKYAKEDTVSFLVNESIQKYTEVPFNEKEITFQYDGIGVIPYTTKVGEKLGTLEIKYKNETLKKMDIILETPLSFDLKKYVQAHPLLLFIPIALVLLTCLFLFKGKKRR